MRSTDRMPQFDRCLSSIFFSPQNLVLKFCILLRYVWGCLSLKFMTKSGCLWLQIVWYSYFDIFIHILNLKIMLQMLNKSSCIKPEHLPITRSPTPLSLKQGVLKRMKATINCRYTIETLKLSIFDTCELLEYGQGWILENGFVNFLKHLRIYRTIGKFFVVKICPFYAEKVYLTGSIFFG